MAKLDELLQTENSFYSIRSDESTMLAIKIQNVFTSAQWMLIRTQPNKRVHSDNWVFSKLNGKDSVSFPVVATEELKQVAREGDFLEWQPGFTASAQSEQEILLDKREQELVHTITNAQEAVLKQEHDFQAKAQTVLTEIETHNQEAQRTQQQSSTEVQEQLNHTKQALEERITTFLTEQEERQRTIASAATEMLTVIQEKQKQFQEQYDTSIQAVEQQHQQMHTLAATFQHNVEAKLHEVEEKVQTLRTDLEEHKPLSLEKHRQNTLHAATRLAIGLIIAGVVFVALTVCATFLLNTNALLIEIFGGICALLALIVALIIAGISFLRPKTA